MSSVLLISEGKDGNPYTAPPDDYIMETESGHETAGDKLRRLTPMKGSFARGVAKKVVEPRDPLDDVGSGNNRGAD